MLTIALLLALLVTLNIQLVIACWLLAKIGDEVVRVRRAIREVGE